MSVYEEVQRNQLVTEVDIQSQETADDYQVKISNISNPTTSQDNVVISDGEFLPHWNESLDFDTWVKMRIENSGRRVLMIHGDSVVNNASNPHDTFIFYDDFEDYTGNDLTEFGRWTLDNVGSPTFTISSAKASVYVDATSEKGYAVGNINVGSDTILEMNMNLISSGGYYGEAGYAAAYADPDHSDVICFADLTVSQTQIGYYTGKAWAESNVYGETVSGYKDYKIIREPAKVRWYINNVLKRTATDTTYIPVIDLPIMFGNTYGNAAGYFYMNTVKSRKYLAVEPTYVSGVEKNISVALQSLGRAG